MHKNTGRACHSGFREGSQEKQEGMQQISFGTYVGRSKTTIVPRPTASNTGWVIKNVLIEAWQQYSGIHVLQTGGARSRDETNMQTGTQYISVRRGLFRIGCTPLR